MTYLLYGGQSEDGRGRGHYVGRTEDPEVARKHFREVRNNPYSTGSVILVTDHEELRIFQEEDIV